MERDHAEGWLDAGFDDRGFGSDLDLPPDLDGTDLPPIPPEEPPRRGGDGGGGGVPRPSTARMSWIPLLVAMGVFAAFMGLQVLTLWAGASQGEPVAYALSFGFIAIFWGPLLLGRWWFDTHARAER